VPGRVGVDAQGLLGVVGVVLEQLGAEGQRSLVLGVELGLGRDAEVQVQLLGDRALRPGALGSAGTCWNATWVPPAFRSTSQSWPCGSGWPGAGGSSPAR